MLDAITNFLGTTGVAKLIAEPGWWQYLVMYVIIGALFYLAIVKKFEPLLLMPIAFGMLLANLPGANLIHLEYFFDDYYVSVENGQFVGTLSQSVANFCNELANYLSSYGMNPTDFLLLTEDSFQVKMEAFANIGWTEETMQSIFESYVPGAHLDAAGIIHIKMSHVIKEVINNGGLVDILYLGVKLGVYPSLIFMGVGAMTDFSPLIANPKSLLMGAGAQLGVFVAFFCALFMGFSPAQAGAIGIIGGADGPTAILVTKILAPELLGAIAIAA